MLANFTSALSISGLNIADDVNVKLLQIGKNINDIKFAFPQNAKLTKYISIFKKLCTEFTNITFEKEVIIECGEKTQAGNCIVMDYKKCIRVTDSGNASIILQTKCESLNIINKEFVIITGIMRKYINIAKNFELGYISLLEDTGIYYNPFQIYNYETKIFNYLDSKVNKLVNLISNLCGIDKEAEIDEIKKSIEKIYSNYGISNDKNSLFSSDKIRYRNETEYPSFLDLINFTKSRKLKKSIQEKIIDKFPIFSNYTNINLLEKLLIIKTGDINDKTLYLINYFLEQINYRIKEDNKSLIYIDEVWKYISSKDNFGLGKYIFELYKTIRKSKAGIITITQDISDIFSYDNGDYGKSILNNSAFKMFFKMSFTDINVLSKLSLLDENIIKNITRLDKGQALIVFLNNSFVINIKLNEYERDVINE